VNAGTSRLVLCLGASIVEGRISSNFVDVLRERMRAEGFRFVNAGVAGYEAYNVLVHLEAAIAQQPDFAVILVGTNDVTASLSPAMARLSRWTKGNPKPPSARFYRDNMIQIVRTLRDRTPARIALASLPVLGEDLESPPNRRTREYNALLQQVAGQEGASYLPVYERQEAYLRAAQPGRGRGFQVGLTPSIKLLAQHFLLRQSFDTIAARNGYLLLTDGMHLNARGAAFLADEVESFLRSNG